VAAVSIPSSVVRRLPRRGTGASLLAVAFKAIAILIWLGTVLILVMPDVDLVISRFSSDLAIILSTLLSNGVVGVALGGFIIGLVLFGIGEIIGLLSNIRRNAR
jgi:hypothetical protein